MDLSDFMSFISDLAITIGSVIAILGINTWKKELQWKRNSDLAEKALFLIYEAESAIKTIRNPISFSSEHAERKADDTEDPATTNAQNMSYVVFSRIDKQSEIFNEMRTARQRCRVLLGEEELECFDDMFKIIRDIQIATRKLARRYWSKDPQKLSSEKKEAFYDKMYALEDTIWETTDDEINLRAQIIIKNAEESFRKFISPPAPYQEFRTKADNFKQRIQSIISSLK